MGVHRELSSFRSFISCFYGGGNHTKRDVDSAFVPWNDRAGYRMI
jgi:hypothetical protein